jgi:phage FluMu gp28-like protein
MSNQYTKEQWAEIRRQAKPVADTALDRAMASVASSHPVLPKAFLGYQAHVTALLEDIGTSVLVVEKSRRIGLTWSLAAYAVLRAARAAHAGGMDVHYISYAQAMTRDFISDCGDWARAFGHAAGEVEEYMWPDGKDENGADRFIQAFRITFASGFEINGLSSAPRSLRGKQGVVIIDEAAFVDNLGELLKAALALLMWGGQVIVCSTHDGSENPFNLLVQDVLGGRLPYKHVKIDFDDALKEGLFERICLRRGRDWSPEGEAAWREEIIQFYGDGADEELYCVPSMGTGSWLSGPLIEARMTEDAPILRLDLPTNYLQLDEWQQGGLMEAFYDEQREALSRLDLSLLFAAGFDFARYVDLSILALLSVDTKLMRRSALTVEMRGVPGDEQKAIVRKVFEHLRGRLMGAAFDATGMGWTVAEDMGRIFGLREKEDGGGLIMPIKFSQDWYRVNMPPLKVAFEDNAIAIHKDSDHLTDLRAVKVLRGIPTVPPVREGAAGKKRHADYAIALALAHYASRMRWSEYGYTAIQPRPSKFDLPAGEDGLGRGTGAFASGPSFRMSSLRKSRGTW